MDSQIKIVLADDHPIVRNGLKMSIQTVKEWDVIAEASDGEAALALVRKYRPHILVLDIDMPKMDGLAVAREMRKQALATKIIFLTLHCDQDLFRSAVDLGSMGYILKDCAALEIKACIQAVSEGRPFYSSALTMPAIKKLEAAIVTPGESLMRHLSPMERKILQLIANGKTSKDIGAELSIHHRTVENHRTAMCRKLSLDGEGPSALLRFALQHRSAL